MSQLPFIPDDCYLSLNASPATIVSGKLPEVLCLAPLDRLVLEVTEQHPIESYEQFGEALRPLRQAGLRLAIDDVGAGFASLKHILRLSPHVVKLDHSLTHAVIPSRSARALAAALTGFAIETGTTVLAEGIETQDQLELLTALGVSLGQGFLLGRPGPPPSPSRRGWRPRAGSRAMSRPALFAQRIAQTGPGANASRGRIRRSLGALRHQVWTVALVPTIIGTLVATAVVIRGEAARADKLRRAEIAAATALPLAQAVEETPQRLLDGQAVDAGALTLSASLRQRLADQVAQLRELWPTPASWQAAADATALNASTARLIRLLATNGLYQANRLESAADSPARQPSVRRDARHRHVAEPAEHPRQRHGVR